MSGEMSMARVKAVRHGDEVVERITGGLFQVIHSQTTRKDLIIYRRRLKRLLDQYRSRFNVPDFIENKSVIEVGCGGGASGIYALTPHHPRSIQAIDLSSQNAESTADICRKLGYQNVTVSQSNAMALPFEDDSFEFVFSNGVIQTAIDPYRCFKEISRVVKPGGYVFLGIYGYGGLFGKMIQPLAMSLGKVIPFRHMERLVRATGLFRSRDNSILDLMYCPKQDTYKKWEIERWFGDNGFEDVISLKSEKWFFNLGILAKYLLGDCFIYTIGNKRQ